MKSMKVLVAMVALIAPLAAAADEMEALRNARGRISAIEAKLNTSTMAHTRRLLNEVAANLVGTVDQQQLSDVELIELFNTLSAVSFYTLNRTTIASLDHTFDELKRRGLLTPVIVSNMYQRLQLSGQFDEAKKFSVAFKVPGAEAYYGSGDSFDKNSNGYDIWEVRKNSKVLNGFTFTPPQGERFALVLGSPQCKFSNRAVKDIEGDTLLRSVAPRAIKWIISPLSWWGPDGISDWNAMHPLSEFSAAANSETFTSLPTWETPSFYIFDNGKLVDHFVGWPDGGNLSRLKAALKIRDAKIDQQSH